ncbi:MAG: glycerol dehydratase reactivase beta/small subunit family protein [Synergistaceae bacterium]|jgi:hypothetical protein|nr:glycerol dehydratase reactivase beta/small subunit family protein [Synergistaceae bacterium]
MNAWFGRVGGRDALPDNKPSIWLVTDPSFEERDARLVASGCEEEGVPLAWDVKSGSSSELARMACLRSRLEVGIGIDSGHRGAIALVAVNDAPYIERDAGTPARLRWIGQAAARMSKGQPIINETQRRGMDGHE